MKWNIITLFPEACSSMISVGVVGQALEKKIIEVNFWNPRNYTADKHKSVDDRPFGGGDGMVMLPEILSSTLGDVFKHNPGTRLIYLSPQGPLLTESKVKQLSCEANVTLICGRYGGIDHRVLVDFPQMEEISIGDYVLSGGELAAAVVVDSVSRKIPGVLGHSDSATEDSFSQGLLEAPMFTRPSLWRGQEVPAILKSGNHAKISEWRKQIAYLVTYWKRPAVFFEHIKQNPLLNRDWKNLDLLWSSLTEDEKKTLGFAGKVWNSQSVQKQVEEQK